MWFKTLLLGLQKLDNFNEGDVSQSEPQFYSFHDLNEKWPFSKPAGGKTKSSTHINYTSLGNDTLRTNLAEFSDRLVRFVSPYSKVG